MATRESYPPGTPSWVDIGSPDTAASAAFYGPLFGWTAEFDGRPEAGGYGLFFRDGVVTAGIGPQQAPGPPYWTVYVTTTSADDTATVATAAGGTVIVEPMDVLDAGRMVVLQDPQGTFVSAWQPNQHIGSQYVNGPGGFSWNELSTTDLAASTAFYAAVFGWTVADGMGGDDANIFQVDGNVVCGAHQAGDGEFPAWSVWFGVEDCDAAAAQVVELGGTIIQPPNDMDFGRGAVVADPHGAVFGIAATNPELIEAAG